MDTQFGTLISELGQILDLKLTPDHLNVCLLQYPDGYTLQLEVDREEIKLLLGSRICTLPPGRFRQDILEQALKANNLDFHIGTFGYSKKNSELYLYGNLQMQNLTARHLADFIGPFSEKARHWISAIASNSVPTLEGTGPAKKSSGMFGLAS